ncbi:SCO2522 family protein [Catenuloplanes japonicus]|uniref:SCO2522 family protein n=1 Tax=Catenuloplanes japonicus TaxID=33876 RepID=UPI000A10A290|nr:SCO2522 family protein [Catenuloplanes japonicus]
MTRADPVFRETSAEPAARNVPLAHLSLELGHLYREDLAMGPEGLVRYFRAVAPWAAAAREACRARLVRGTPRVATCFLIDDYFAPFGRPDEIIPMLMECAAEAELPIDYIAREAGCAVADGVPLAQLVEHHIVNDPVPGSNGDRPPASESGWLCNGQRSPHTAAAQAMVDSPGWSPPLEHAANRHSIFADVQLWDETGGERTWSCAFLAAVWQLLRLGLLRDRDEPVAVPHPVPAVLPDDWRQVPSILRMNPRAAPFSAYRTVSVLGNRFLSTEHGVRTILSQIAVERAAADQLLQRADAEGFALPADLTRRVEYIFVDL